MSLINDLLKPKLSTESDNTDPTSVEPAATDVGTADPAAATTEPAADPVTPAATPEAATAASTEPTEPTGDVDPVTPTEPTPVDDSLTQLDTDLDAVRSEVEQVHDDLDDTVEATAKTDQLEETVASMEALIERGFISEPELRLVLGRGTRRVNRLGVENFFLTTESYGSDEGRMETLRLAAESFSETAGRVRDAISSGWNDLKARIGGLAKRLLDSNERIKQAAVALEGKVHALGDSPTAETVALNAKDHAFLADQAGATLPPTDLSSKVVAASKALLSEYPKLVASVADDKPVPKINAAALKGLSAALNVVYDVDGLPTFATKPESSVEARKAIKVLPKAALEQILKNVIASTEVLRGNWIGDIITPASEGTNEHLDKMDVLASNLLDFYFYAQRVNRALLALVQAQVTHYGVQA